MDASLNRYGIPVDQARDEELGWDVDFVTDFTEAEVQSQIKSEFGDKGLPPGVVPVVTLNQSVWQRVQAERGETPSQG